MKSKVVVLKCPTYNAAEIRDAIERGFYLVGGWENYLRRDERILLKPNMLSAKRPEMAVTTHPEFVLGCVKYFSNISQDISIGDSPGAAINGVEKIWDETGMNTVCEKEKVKKIIFEKSGTTSVKSRNPRNYRVKSIELSNAVLDTDAVISLPKMKTHTLMLFTGAIKNLYGCIPGLRKAHYHFSALHPDDFGELLADILYYVKPRFAIVDAINSMEGEGPSAGNVRNTGLIIMGPDLVAVDTVLAVIMGFNPRRDPTLRAAERMQLGTARLEEIEVVGDGKLEDFVLSDFKKPSNWKIKMVPRFIGTLVKKIFWAKPEINQSICTKCQLCLKSCPASAIFQDGEILNIKKGLCIECMCCHELCPQRAITIKFSLLADILTRNSSARKKC